MLSLLFLFIGHFLFREIHYLVQRKVTGKTNTEGKMGVISYLMMSWSTS